MIKLAAFDDALQAQELIERLAAAHINATHHTDITARGAWQSGQTTVYLNDDEDEANIDVAQAILADFTRELENDQQRSDTCQACGYDLRGHDEATGKCPECGRPFQKTSTDQPCPHCGEDCPADFDNCWNCGKLLGGPS